MPQSADRAIMYQDRPGFSRRLHGAFTGTILDTCHIDLVLTVAENGDTIRGSLARACPTPAPTSMNACFATGGALADGFGVLAPMPGEPSRFYHGTIFHGCMEFKLPTNSSKTAVAATKRQYTLKNLYTRRGGNGVRLTEHIPFTLAGTGSYITSKIDKSVSLDVKVDRSDRPGCGGRGVIRLAVAGRQSSINVRLCGLNFTFSRPRSASFVTFRPAP